MRIGGLRVRVRCDDDYGCCPRPEPGLGDQVLGALLVGAAGALGARLVERWFASQGDDEGEGGESITPDELADRLAAAVAERMARKGDEEGET